MKCNDILAVALVVWLTLVLFVISAVGEKMRLPDDVTMGYIVEQLAGVAMTRLDQFHSHLEPLRLVTDLPNQISFSYSAPSSEGGAAEANLIEVEDGGFSLEQDPTRFLTIHCALFPSTSWCQEQ
jgi:fringe protein